MTQQCHFCQGPLGANTLRNKHFAFCCKECSNHASDAIKEMIAKLQTALDRLRPQ